MVSRQGENLSPLLFSIYVNDFNSHLKKYYSGVDISKLNLFEDGQYPDIDVFLNLYTLLYADDTIILAESAPELQMALNGVCDYCTSWKLTVNTTKTKVVIFSRGKVRRFPTFFFGDNQLDVQHDYVYLGTTLNYNGSFNKP